MGIPTRALAVLIAGPCAERPAAAVILFPDLTIPANTDLFPRTFASSSSLPHPSSTSPLQPQTVNAAAASQDPHSPDGRQGRILSSLIPDRALPGRCSTVTANAVAREAQSGSRRESDEGGSEGGTRNSKKTLLGRAPPQPCLATSPSPSSQRRRHGSRGICCSSSVPCHTCSHGRTSCSSSATRACRSRASTGNLKVRVISGRGVVGVEAVCAPVGWRQSLRGADAVADVIRCAAT